MSPRSIGLNEELHAYLLRWGLAQEIEFSGRAGAPQTTVLFGDPTKAGFYVRRVKFRKGTKVLPHWHADEPRTVVVLSGTLHFAFGTKASRGLAARDLLRRTRQGSPFRMG